MVKKLHQIDTLYLQCKFVVEACLIHEMSYLFAIHCIPRKILSVNEFLISNGIVFHITGPDYHKLFLNKLKLGLGI